MSWRLSNKAFILLEKPHVAIDGEWKNEQDGVIIHFDLYYCIFNGNESEEFQNFFERVDTLANPDPDKLLPKLNADE